MEIQMSDGALEKEILQKYYGKEGLLSIDKFARKFNYPRSLVKKVLEETDVHQRTSLPRIKKEFYPITAFPRDEFGRDDQIQIDYLFQKVLSFS